MCQRVAENFSKAIQIKIEGEKIKEKTPLFSHPHQILNEFGTYIFKFISFERLVVIPNRSKLMKINNTFKHILNQYR